MMAPDNVTPEMSREEILAKFARDNPPEKVLALRDELEASIKADEVEERENMDYRRSLGIGKRDTMTKAARKLVEKGFSCIGWEIWRFYVDRPRAGMARRVPAD